MKDGESRPALKQVRQDDDSDPDMDEPLANITNSNEKTVPIVWSAEAKDPPNFPFNVNSGFLIDIPENAGPTYFFKLFLTDDLIIFWWWKQTVIQKRFLMRSLLSKILCSKNGNQQIPMK